VLYKLCLIVNVGLVFYKGSCERLILSLAVRLSLFLYWLYFICLVFYEQINDDDEKEDDDYNDRNPAAESYFYQFTTILQLHTYIPKQQNDYRTEDGLA